MPATGMPATGLPPSGQVQRLAIFGITGRMGRSLLRVLHEETSWRLSGALASPHNPCLGQDAAGAGAPTGVKVTADARAALQDAEGREADAAVDFSAAEAVAEHARACAAAGVPLLVGTTALQADSLAALKLAAETIPVLIAPNTSVGVGVLAELVRIAARVLPDGYDVEIQEAHHRMKRDAPSGTALKLGEIVTLARTGAGRPQNLEDVAVYNRHGAQAPRTSGSIGFSVVRGGDIVGEHTVIFAGDGERLEMTHRATDRDVFARGALRGAAWLVRRTPGMYSMNDVLGT
jgi:4-hydroxy-tetrahydrodipicolinate reductase